MSQCCGKIPNDNDVAAIKKSIAKGNALQGDIGEQVAAQVVSERLNLTAEFFDPPNNGFDAVFRDKGGKLVIVEAKLTSGSGSSSLGMTNHGRQGSVEWIEYNAQLMCDPSSSRYSPDNAKIGQEILRVGAQNVRMVLVHTDPQTLESDITELR